MDDAAVMTIFIPYCLTSRGAASSGSTGVRFDGFAKILYLHTHHKGKADKPEAVNSKKSFPKAPK